MALALTIRNRQRSLAVDLRLLRRIARSLLADELRIPAADLGVFVIAAPEMTRLNETFLRHAGSTDVIAFDYAGNEVEQSPSLSPRTRTGKMPVPQTPLHGEIFVCVDEAVIQARRFRTRWQSELVRYLVHGVLHLRGFDDHTPAARHRMKREEDRRLRALAARFPLNRLGGKTRLRA